mmetsp:Transcript_13166/g.39820  ORF Transcript_13166/g.39820 Transcript_13166/m.39820 type:complete len:292 (-) Transcript_13166:1353-2228(-)
MLANDEDLPVATPVSPSTSSKTMKIEAVTPVVEGPVKRAELLKKLVEASDTAATFFDGGRAQKAVEAQRNCAARYFLSDARLLDALRGELECRVWRSKYLVYRKLFHDIIHSLQSPDDKYAYYLTFADGWRLVPHFPSFTHAVATASNKFAQSPLDCARWHAHNQDVKLFAVNGEIHVRSWPAAGGVDGIYTQDLAAPSGTTSRPTYRKRRDLKPSELEAIDAMVAALSAPRKPFFFSSSTQKGATDEGKERESTLTTAQRPHPSPFFLRGGADKSLAVNWKKIAPFLRRA